MRYCSACRIREGTIHAFLIMDIVAPTSTKHKDVSFWLCPQCEKLTQKTFTRNADQKERVARLLAAEEPRFAKGNNGQAT